MFIVYGLLTVVNGGVMKFRCESTLSLSRAPLIVLFIAQREGRESSRVARRKTYFHLLLSIQYVKFLWKGISIR